MGFNYDTEMCIDTVKPETEIETIYGRMTMEEFKREYSKRHPIKTKNE